MTTKCGYDNKMGSQHITNFLGLNCCPETLNGKSIYFNMNHPKLLSTGWRMASE
jgi:hypothetical protein